MNNRNPLTALKTDIEVAAWVVSKYGYLTPSVQSSLERWFADVNLDTVFPVVEMPLDEKEKTSLLTVALADMLNYIGNVKDKNLDVEESFQQLAPLLDPLWREIAGILAPERNQAWESIRPRDPEELEQRISYMEQILNESREELYQRSKKDTKLRAAISRLGLTPEELKPR